MTDYQTRPCRHVVAAKMIRVRVGLLTDVHMIWMPGRTPIVFVGLLRWTCWAKDCPQFGIGVLPSIAAMARDLHMSRQAVSGCVQMLKTCGYVEVLRQAKNAASPTVFRLPKYDPSDGLRDGSDGILDGSDGLRDADTATINERARLQTETETPEKSLSNTSAVEAESPDATAVPPIPSAGQQPTIGRGRIRTAAEVVARLRTRPEAAAAPEPAPFCQRCADQGRADCKTLRDAFDAFEATRPFTDEFVSDVIHRAVRDRSHVAWLVRYVAAFAGHERQRPPSPWHFAEDAWRAMRGMLVKRIEEDGFSDHGAQSHDPLHPKARAWIESQSLALAELRERWNPVLATAQEIEAARKLGYNITPDIAGIIGGR